MAQKSITHYILRIPQLTQKVGLSRASIYRLMKLGIFPQSIKIGISAVGWDSDDIDHFLSERKRATIH